MIPRHIGCKWTLPTTPRKDSLPDARINNNKPFKRAKPGIDMPTPGPIAWENHPAKRHAPPYSLQHCLPYPRQGPKKMFNRLKLQEYVVPIHSAYYSAMKSHHRNYEMMSLVDHKLTKVNQREEDKRILYPLQAKIFQVDKRTNLKHTHTQILEFKHKQAIPPSLRDKFSGEDKQIHRNL